MYGVAYCTELRDAAGFYPGTFFLGGGKLPPPKPSNFPPRIFGQL